MQQLTEALDKRNDLCFYEKHLQRTAIFNAQQPKGANCNIQYHRFDLAVVEKQRLSYRQNISIDKLYISAQHLIYSLPLSK